MTLLLLCSGHYLLISITVDDISALGVVCGHSIHITLLHCYCNILGMYF